MAGIDLRHFETLILFFRHLPAKFRRANAPIFSQSRLPAKLSRPRWKISACFHKNLLLLANIGTSRGYFSYSHGMIFAFLRQRPHSSVRSEPPVHACKNAHAPALIPAPRAPSFAPSALDMVSAPKSRPAKSNRSGRLLRFRIEPIRE